MAESGPDGAQPAERTVYSAPAAVKVSVVTLCILAIFYTAFFARLILIPIAFAILLYLLLAPFVRLVHRKLHLHRVIGAVLAVTILISGMLSAFYIVAGPAETWTDKLPSIAVQVERKLREFKSPVESVERATEKVQQLADPPKKVRSSDDPMPVVVQGPSLAETLLGRTTTLTASMVMTTVLLLFLLATGDTILRQLITIVPAWSAKKKLVEAVRETESEISHYLMAITLINIGLGVCIGVSMWLLDMPNPILWGGMAAVLNFMPYIGCIANVVVVGLVALVTFSDWTQILAPPLVVLGLNTLEGQFITPALVARRLALNPVAVLLSLIVWGWLWGIPGTLLAVPLLAVGKIIADRIDSLRPFGALLGRPEKPRMAEAVSPPPKGGGQAPLAKGGGQAPLAKGGGQAPLAPAASLRSSQSE